MGSIAHYKILERAGDSGLGEVFRARDTRLGRTVAVTIPPAAIQDDPVKREALLADARAAAAVSHPNIAALYETGEEQGRVFLAFEFVPGDPLSRIVAGHALNARRAIDLTVQMADALADAHAAELTHGNLTSDAVVITPKGNAKILDVGFGRWTREDGATGSERDDLRSLGTIFFQMLTGRAPDDDRTPPTLVNRLLPSEVDEIASKALSADEERGYQGAATLAADLRALGAVLEVRAEAAGASKPSVRGARRASKTPWIGAAVIVILAAMAAVWWWLR